MRNRHRFPEAVPVQEWAAPEPFDFDAWKAAEADAYHTVRTLNQMNVLASMQPGRYRFALHQMTFLPTSAFATRDSAWHWHKYMRDAWERAVRESPEAAAIHALCEFIADVKSRPIREKQERRLARRNELLEKKRAKLATVFAATDAAIGAVFETADRLAKQEDRRRCTG